MYRSKHRCLHALFIPHSSHQIIREKPEGGAFTIWICRQYHSTRGSIDQWKPTKLGNTGFRRVELFLLLTAPVFKKMVADRPLMVKLPNGDTVRLSHIVELDLPLLPRRGWETHIVPGLASHSLVSVVKLCNAGCQVDVRDICVRSGKKERGLSNVAKISA